MDIFTNETGIFNESMVHEYTENYLSNDTSEIMEALEPPSALLLELSYIFNGPLTVFIVAIGVILNIITLYNLHLNMVLKKQMRLRRVRELVKLSSAGQIETQRLTGGSARSTSHCESPAPLSPTKNSPFRYPKLERHTSMIARSPTNSSVNSPTSPTRKTSLTHFSSMRQPPSSLPRRFTPNGDASPAPPSPGSVRLSGTQFFHPVHFQRKSEKRPRMYIFLIWLTFWDTAILLGALLLYSIPTVLTSAYKIYATLFPLFYMFCNGALTASVWLTLAFMVDRYKKVTKPFHKMVIAQNNATPVSETKIHLFMILLSALAITFALPRFFEINVDVNMEDNRYMFLSTALSESHYYNLWYRIIGGVVFYSALPYILMFVISARIWIALREAAKRRAKMTNTQMSVNGNSKNQQNQGSSTTESDKILITVTIKFLVSRLLTTVMDVAEHLFMGSESFVTSQFATFCVDSSNLIVIISSVMNFFIFYAFSSAFRHSTFIALYSLKRKNAKGIADHDII